MSCLFSELAGLGRKETWFNLYGREVRAVYPTASPFLPLPPLLIPHFFLVCSTPHLPASPVLHLVWEPGWLAWKHHHLEAVCRLPHLPHHALPLPWLLAGTQVPGTKDKINDNVIY